MASEHVVKITEANFETEVLRSDLPVFLDFFAAWCYPCHSVASIIDELADEYKGRVKVGRVDADDNRKLIATYNVQTVPVCLVFSNGLLVDGHRGRKAKREYVAMIEGVLAR